MVKFPKYVYMLQGNAIELLNQTGLNVQNVVLIKKITLKIIKTKHQRFVD